MAEKLQKLALIAEITGGIAIVASLVFVGMQIRQSTNVAKATSYQNLLEQVGVWRSEVADDADLARLFILYGYGKADTFTEEERVRMVMYETNYFGIVESGFFARKYGLMGESEWRRLSDGACVHFQRLKGNFGETSAPGYMTDDFLAYLEANC